MLRRRRRRNPKPIEEEKPTLTPGNRSRNRPWIKDIHSIRLSGRLHGMAEHLERFEQMAELITLISSPKNSNGLRLTNFITNKDSLNYLFKAVLPVFRNAVLIEEISDDPKKVEPIKVETKNSETRRTKKD